MPKLRLETRDDQTHFFPGDVLHGYAEWQLEDAPQSAEVRLSWYTEGKGDQDVYVARHEPLDNALAVDARDFEFELPDQPYSFSGKLITLCWALELIIDGEHSKRIDLVIAPDRQEIDLTNLTAEPAR